MQNQKASASSSESFECAGALRVRSRGVVIREITISGGMNIGSASRRQRQNDGGNSSRDRLCQESVRALAGRHGVSPTTVQKWKKRGFVADARMGPKDSRSTVLSVEQEAACIAFRRHTLPLDDGLYALQPSIPLLTRSSLHRLFQRPPGLNFGHQPAGGCQGQASPIDVQGLCDRLRPHRPKERLWAEVRTEEGKLQLFVGPKAAIKADQPERAARPSSPSSGWRPRLPA